MRRSNQLRRTDDLLRKIISEAILTKVSDPRVGLVTVTGVQVSPEFDTAKVFVSILGGEEERQQSLEGLKSASSFLQSEIAREVRMRRIPRLRFIYDDSLDRSLRIESALRSIDEEPPEREETE